MRTGTITIRSVVVVSKSDDIKIEQFIVLPAIYQVTVFVIPHVAIYGIAVVHNYA